MTRAFAALLFAAVLMGQDCEETPPPIVNDYCHGNDYSIVNNVEYGLTVDGVSGGFSAILHGDPSDDPRSTVQVTFGQAYCTGVVLSPQIVLTAGHCGYASTTDHTVRVYERGTASAATSAVEPDMRRVSQATGLPTDDPKEPTFDYNANGLAAADGPLVLVASLVASNHIVHPDYLKYVNSGNLEDRKADLMVLRLSAPLPASVPSIDTFYDPTYAKFCNGIAIQGFGRHEGSGLDLRETKYVITDTSDPKLLISRFADVPDGEESGLACFGDSGGPCYADVAGVPQLCGITTTTMSEDCLVGSSYVNVAYPPFRQWIAVNTGIHTDGG